MKAQQNRSHLLESLIKPALIILLVGFIFSVMLAVIAYGSSVSGATFAQKTNSLFGLDSTQIWWYVTRAAGLTGYILLWLSMAWGLAIPSKIVQPVLEGTFTYDFHEYLSLLGLGFVLLHIVVLLFDKYLPFSILQLVIPFVDGYRPFWVGLGIIGFYIFLVVTVTFYLREQIGTRAFRAVHVFSLLGYLGATLHGLFAGTDSSLPVTLLLYTGTFLVIVFLTVYWLVMRRAEKVLAPAPVRTVNRKAHKHR
jgi:sulfoxide reductase heme-binding subunit YedZ